MRAPFDDLVTLYDGPGTATPGFPRVVGAQCRWVSDPYFEETNVPLGLSAYYFTIDSSQPSGSLNTDQGDGNYRFDFSRADRAEFASFPGFSWVVLRVEACTRPGLGAPYWRASICPENTVLQPCWKRYQDVFTLRVVSDGSFHSLTRTDKLRWEGDGYTMVATLVAGDPNCMATWTVSNGVTIGEGGPWNATPPTDLALDDMSTHTHTYDVYTI